MTFPAPTPTPLTIDATCVAPPVVRRFAIHGVALDLSLDVAGFDSVIEHLLGDFAIGHPPIGVSPLRGALRPFAEAEVLKRISPRARLIGNTLAGQHRSFDSIEMFEDGDRYWIVDERWGIAEIDLLKGQWTSWIMPAATLEPRRCIEAAIQWPLAQLVQRRGIHLLPAVSVARGSIGTMCIAPFNLGPELNACIRAGYKLVGQRWTVLREQSQTATSASQRFDPSFELRQMPGWVDVPERISWPLGSPRRGQEHVLDLAAENCGASRARADCNAILVIQPARRAASCVERVPSGRNAAQLLRAVWPIIEAHPKQAKIVITRLATSCPVFQVTLSRDPQDLPRLLAGVIPAVAHRGITVQLHAASTTTRLGRSVARSA